MSLPGHQSADRSAGFILLAVFALGLLGATFAILLNNGDLPSQFASRRAAPISAPL